MVAIKVAYKFSQIILWALMIVRYDWNWIWLFSTKFIFFERKKKLDTLRLTSTKHTFQIGWKLLF